MKCTTVRQGFECVFMSKHGCTFHEGSCNPIVEQCKGCSHIVKWNDTEYCNVFPDPSFKWSYGYCNFATHIKLEIAETRRINPLKASKKKVKGQM